MKIALTDMPIDELVQLFAENCIEQDEAIFKEQISEFKKIFNVMFELDKELRRSRSRRAVSARKALRTSEFAS